MAPAAFARLTRSIHITFTDPFGFAAAFQDLHLAPEELPQLTREARLEGLGR